MTKTQLVALGIRIAAIVYLVFVIRGAADYIFAFGQHLSFNAVPNASIFGICLLVLVGVVLWMFPMMAAKNLLPKDGDEKLEWKLSLEDIEVTAIVLLGLTTLVLAIPDLIYWSTFYYFTKAQTNYMDFSPYQISGMTIACIELLFGLWLLLRAKKIRDFIFRFRSDKSV